MVGIVMNARIETQSAQEFHDLNKRMKTPNRSVDIKNKIETRTRNVEAISRKNTGKK